MRNDFSELRNEIDRLLEDKSARKRSRQVDTGTYSKYTQIENVGLWLNYYDQFIRDKLTNYN